MEAAHFTQKDRETLTKVETKLDRAIQDIAGLSNNFATREEASDLEKRIGKLESKVETLNMKSWMAIGGIAIITSFVIPLGIYIFNTKTLRTDDISRSVVEAINQYNLSIDK